MGDRKKAADGPEHNPAREGVREEAESASTGLEGAAEEESGFLRRQPVEGGEEVSIGGSPPSAAGGEIGSPVPTQEDVRRS